MKHRLGRWPALWLVLALLLLATLWLAQGLGRLPTPPFELLVNGQDLSHPFNLDGLDALQRLGVAGGLLVAGLVLLLALGVLLPLALLAGLGLVLLLVLGVVLAALGGPLLALALGLALLLSPLVLLVLLLRWLLR